MQVILGAGGAIGREITLALKDYTEEIRQVGRNPKPVLGTEELMKADLTIPEDALRAVKGCEIAYLTIGLPYSHKVWAKLWPQVMQNVIDACITENTKLVFFDNIYMYDPDYLENMDENTPNNPSSKKGQVRKQIFDLLMANINSGKLTALVARCADYYGASIVKNSMLTETVLTNIYRGKAANWLGPLQYKHSFTYIVDAGRATTMLGNTSDAYNQVWHLPTADNPPTGKEWTEMVAKKMGKESKTIVVSRFLATLMGIFVPVMKEVKEMMYQYDRNYIFNSHKFNERFKFTPTSYQEGLDHIIATDYSKKE